MRGETRPRRHRDVVLLGAPASRGIAQARPTTSASSTAARTSCTCTSFRTWAPRVTSARSTSRARRCCTTSSRPTPPRVLRVAGARRRAAHVPAAWWLREHVQVEARARHRDHLRADRSADTRPVRFTVDAFYQWHFTNAFTRGKQLVDRLRALPDFASFYEIGSSRPGRRSRRSARARRTAR